MDEIRRGGGAVMLENKLGLDTLTALDLAEEQLSKKRALDLFDEIYNFAGELC